MFDYSLLPTIAFGVGSAIAAAGAAGLLAKRRFRRRLDEANSCASIWRSDYGLELKRRLNAEDQAADQYRVANGLAMKLDRARRLMAQAHYRDPNTGRLSPRGVFPSEELN